MIKGSGKDVASS